MKPTEVFDYFCPSTWSRLKAVRIFANATDKANEGDIQLSASQKFGVIPQSKLMEEEDTKYMLALSGTENFKHVQVNDFVISLRSFEGGFEHSAYDGCVSPAYTVLRPKIELHPAFWKHLFKSSIFKDMLAAFNVGVRDGKSIRYDDFSQFLLAVPRLDVQKAIATRLDRETARIDALVEKKTRFIELLREKRQALITHAVTKGLDPNVKMKDSGVEWLGEVPEHWVAKKVAYWISTSGSGTTPAKEQDYCLEEDEGIPWVTTGELRENTIASTQKYVTASAITEYSALKVHPVGSLVIAMYGATVGRLAILGVPASLNQACFAIHPCSSISMEFLRYWIEGFRIELMEMATGAGQPNISADKIRNLVVAAPKSLIEQEKVVDFLIRNTSLIDALIEKTERSIELLKERRSALITAAVTGQIDLREAA
ncbi:restriction endonuclease subunit S [Burkholderia vietnamiensis]|uniref:restriction endonuclease subunit S n=1 Tax=Burkholderia vietnamiensis TaxID=60552 RepID=UPI001B9D42FC|nr:restriction endonuclease subunit S [Burkholderia vietnamiensis]MBR8194183.1 restriction endonuclease subunit S [Burkholderia vietnamiensis]